ncbi:MAG TPA: tetratricopeptide repeat protein [Cytophagales bacterium]|nr:tetratricopeptide repeat protein [Cytophagales bacterium]
MDQKRFLELLRDPKGISKEDAAELMELRNNFPYFQISHVLSTLAAHQNNSIYFEELLKKAALTTTNRRKLKVLLDAVKNPKNDPSNDAQITTQENIAILRDIEEQKIPTPSLEQHTEKPLIPSITIPLADGLEQIEEKQKAETYLEPAQESQTPLTPEYITITPDGSSSALDVIETPKIPEVTPITRVIPKNTTNATILHEQAIDSYRTQESPFPNAEVDLFNEKITELLDPQDNIEKVNAQNAIDSFLQNPPRAKKAFFISDEDEEREDLSEKFTTNSGEFFSESLANIYTKQGKYVKAIETYNKLILTNPQKSAYFASKILEIQNLQK